MPFFTEKRITYPTSFYCGKYAIYAYRGAEDGTYSYLHQRDLGRLFTTWGQQKLFWNPWSFFLRDFCVGLKKHAFWSLTEPKLSTASHLGENLTVKRVVGKRCCGAINYSEVIFLATATKPRPRQQQIKQKDSYGRWRRWITAVCWLPGRRLKRKCGVPCFLY